MDVDNRQNALGFFNCNYKAMANNKIKLKNKYQERILGRFENPPKLYHPELDDMIGLQNASRFVIQLLHWYKRNTDPDGIYKTYEEWKKEIGLSKRELAPIIKKCVSLGFLAVKRKVPKGKIGVVNYYLLDIDKLDKLINKHN